ncbi:MAG: KpsF/GutQ family sugar-phosphate isomerase [Planctomycetaceae bacterium]|nr:KpsF/GutQ family sugar-phosphate isomerase [Planctomycetaceae bacterium]
MPGPSENSRHLLPLAHCRAESDQRPAVPAASPTRLQQLADARAIIRREGEALLRVAADLGPDFCLAVERIQRTSGSVIVTGVGKAGLIGQKIVATMASTGTRSYFLHPTEAVHGDLGCVGENDIVLALSNSGTSEEILRLLPILSRLKIPVIAVTRDRQNPLARQAEVVLELGHHAEAGELRLAPSVSTTAMLAIGDALALVLSHARGFTEQDFAVFHPAGQLGRNLRPVSEVMRCGDQLRIAKETDTVRQVLIELSRPGRRTGAVVLTRTDGCISGIFTDSDLARLFEHREERRVEEPISAVMTRSPVTTSAETLLPEAIRLMSQRKLSELPVIDAEGRPVGLLDITDVIDCRLEAESQGGEESSSASAAAERCRSAADSVQSRSA